MSNTIRLLQSNTVVKSNAYEEELFGYVLKALAEKYNKKDYMVQEYVDMKTSTISMIEKKGYWRRTKDGFINRSDFNYNGKDIIYQTNMIRKSKDQYVIDSDSSSKAKEDFKNNEKVISLLAKIEIVLDGFYQEHKEEVDTIMKYYLGSLELEKEIDPEVRKRIPLKPYPPTTKKKSFIRIRMENSYITSTLSEYGSSLIVRVINTLNELENVKDIETYAKEFALNYVPLVRLANEQHSSVLDDYIRIPYIIANLVEIYSVHGKAFSQTVEKELSKLTGPLLSFEDPMEQNGLTNM